MPVLNFDWRILLDLGAICFLLVLTNFAALQDFKTRSINAPVTYGLMGLTLAAFALHQQYEVIGYYLFFQLWSYFFYEKRKLQIVTALLLIGFCFFTPWGFFSAEARYVTLMIGVFWLTFFWKGGGGADYNVLVTTLAVLNIANFMYFVLTLTVVFFGFILYETFLHSQAKTITEKIYLVYFKLTQPQFQQPFETIYQGKREKVPIIPLLYVTQLLALVVISFWSKLPFYYYIIAIGVGILTSFFVLLKDRQSQKESALPIGKLPPEHTADEQE